MDELFTAEEAAEKIRSNAATLAYWRHIGKGPKWGKIGRRVVYRRSDVEAWIDEQFQSS